MRKAVDPEQRNEDDYEYKKLMILIEKIKTTFDFCKFRYRLHHIYLS